MDFRVRLGRLGRLGMIDRSGRPDDEYDEMNLMKNTILYHSAWCAGSKMAWMGRFDRLD